MVVRGRTNLQSAPGKKLWKTSRGGVKGRIKRRKGRGRLKTEDSKIFMRIHLTPWTATHTLIPNRRHSLFCGVHQNLRLRTSASPTGAIFKCTPLEMALACRLHKLAPSAHSIISKSTPSRFVLPTQRPIHIFRSCFRIQIMENKSLFFFFL